MLRVRTTKLKGYDLNPSRTHRVFVRVELVAREPQDSQVIAIASQYSSRENAENKINPLSDPLDLEKGRFTVDVSNPGNGANCYRSLYQFVCNEVKAQIEAMNKSHITEIDVINIFS